MNFFKNAKERENLSLVIVCVCVCVLKCLSKRKCYKRSSERVCKLDKLGESVYVCMYVPLNIKRLNVCLVLCHREAIHKILLVL